MNHSNVDFPIRGLDMSKFVDKEYAKSLNKDDAIYDLQSVSYYRGDMK